MRQPGGLVIESNSIDEWPMLPLLPVIIMETFAGNSPETTDMDTLVEVAPFAGGAMGLVSNSTVTPGTLLADNVTDELKPAMDRTSTVDEPEPPETTLRNDGDRESVKSPLTPRVIRSRKLVGRDMKLLPIPRTTTLLTPVVAFGAASITSVVDAWPSSGTEIGLSVKL